MVDFLGGSVLLLGMPGWPELLLILFIVVLIFGSGKLANMGKGMGEGIRNFRKGLKGDEAEEMDAPKAEKKN
jgi:sec-independent protein translocase protein TatA